MVRNGAGEESETTYDTLGRVVESIDGEDRVRSSTVYDSAGRVASVTADAVATTSYGYDALGRQVTVSDARGGQTARTDTPGGRVDTVTGPIQQLVISRAISGMRIE